MPRDNILLITTDQQRFDTINALGKPEHLHPPSELFGGIRHRLYPVLWPTAPSACPAVPPL